MYLPGLKFTITFCINSDLEKLQHVKTNERMSRRFIMTPFLRNANKCAFKIT